MHTYTQLSLGSQVWVAYKWRGEKELRMIELSMPYVPKIWKSIIKPIWKLTCGKKIWKQTHRNKHDFKSAQQVEPTLIAC